MAGFLIAPFPVMAYNSIQLMHQPMCQAMHWATVNACSWRTLDQLLVNCQSIVGRHISYQKSLKILSHVVNVLVVC